MAQVSEEQIINDLNRCLTVLTGSVAEYLLESDPYITDNDKDAMGALAEIAAADKKFGREAGLLIEELEGIPQMGAFNPALAGYNYLSFPTLLDVMIEHKQQQIPMYRELIGRVPNYPDVRSFYQRVLAAHEQHLERLQSIRKSRYKSEEPEEEETEETPEAEGGAEVASVNGAAADEEAEAEDAETSEAEASA